MLVINANNTQDVTNFMLNDPQYPDTNQILMFGGPQYNVTVASGTITPSFPVLKTIGTTNINYFCPRIYKQGLLQGNFIRTSGTTESEFMSSADIYRYLYRLSNAAITMNCEYTIAVSGLRAGQVIGEEIIAPIGLIGQRLGASSVYIATGTFTIKFFLLHSDGTTTTIVSGTPTYQGGNAGTSGTRVINYQGSLLGMAIHALKYSGTGQIAQEGDILCATVTLNGSRGVDGAGGSGNPFAGVGISHGGTNNNNPFDPHGFRPFQVSIRDN